MANEQRKGGIISIKIDGERVQAKGNWSYGLGKPIREGIVGADEVHGYKETVAVPFIEGEITDGKDVDLDKIADITNSMITLELANGKTVVLNKAWTTNPDGLKGETEEGNIQVRFEGLTANMVS